MTLYFASQDIERLQKTIISIYFYGKYFSESVKKALFGYDYILLDGIISSFSDENNHNEKVFLEMLKNFYNKGRYSSYKYININNIGNSIIKSIWRRFE